MSALLLIIKTIISAIAPALIQALGKPKLVSTMEQTEEDASRQARLLRSIRDFRGIDI